jgi:hypothetical protein
MRYLIPFGFFILIFSACNKVDPEITDFGRRIVINGLITTDNLLNVRISKSAHISDINVSLYSSAYDLDGADVRFYQNNTYIDSLHYVLMPLDAERMYYYGNYWSYTVLPLSGMQYKIVAKAPGLPDAEANIVMPNIVRIERVDTSRILLSTSPSDTNNSNIQLICKISFNDPGSEINYYLFNIYRSPSWGQIPNIYFNSQDPIVEEYLNSYQETEGIVFSDKIINGNEYNLVVNIDANLIGMPFYNDTPIVDGIPYPDHKKTIFFRLYSITEEYFRYIQTLNRYNKNYTNPLADPVLVESNIIGGYGILGGAAISIDSLVFYY